MDADWVDFETLYSTTLTSHRLSIEPLTQTHAPLLLDGLRDERVYEWISATPPTSLSALNERYARLERQRGAVITTLVRGPVVLPLTHNLDWAVRLVGEERCIGKLDAEIQDKIATNVGYIFFAEFWNQGLATEAVQTLALALERAGIVEQRACVTRGNDASVRVLEKANFRFSRIIADNDTIRGQSFDDLEFVRTVTNSDVV